MLERWDGDERLRKSLTGVSGPASRFNTRDKIAYADAIYTNDDQKLAAMGKYCTVGVPNWHIRDRRGWTRALKMKTNIKGGENIPKKTTKEYQSKMKIPVRKCRYNKEDHFLVAAILENTWGAEGDCIRCGYRIKFHQYCGFCAKCNRHENRHSSMDDEEKSWNGSYWWCAQCCEQEASDPEEEHTQWVSKWGQSSCGSHSKKRKCMYYESKKEKKRKSKISDPRQ